MDTDTLRTMTTEHCARMRGKLWPNGSGFDRRGWEYSYSESSHDWCAVYRPMGRERKFGRGATPEEAKAHAKVVL